MPVVIEAFSEAVAAELADAFAAAEVVALDVEGVELSRHGAVSLVQLATPSRCFLLDLLGKGRHDPLVLWLRGFLERTDVVKIIHDCRMDVDALHHVLAIDLVNVHDTSCWHAGLTGLADKNLNDTLAHNGLQVNRARDSSVYKRNPAFWATRPLTPQMVAWAAGDVQCMFGLYAAQRSGVTETPYKVQALQESFLSWKAADVGLVIVPEGYIGSFIGRGGANIRQVQRQTTTMIYPRQPNGTYRVYYHCPTALQKVNAAVAALDPRHLLYSGASQ
jgi:ribonuclease D